MSIRQPVPPFTFETAQQKVRAAEDVWNQQDPENIALAYTHDSQWRNRDIFLRGREAIITFLKNKWNKEKQYKLIKELWAFHNNRIAVRFVYEWCDNRGYWWRSYGNENWVFNVDGLMAERHASINDISIRESERLLCWEGRKRPYDYPSLTELGL